MNMATPKDPDSIELVQSRIQESIEINKALLSTGEIAGKIDKISRTLILALSQRKKVLLFGNGGSAADAQHIAAELIGRFLQERPALPAIALTVNPSVMTAIANDYDFTAVFARQLEALGQPGDVAIAFSTSGNSPNILEGIEAARQLGIATVGLTGASGGKLRDLVDDVICVPSTDTQRIQEVHILLGHILCEIIERELFPNV